MGRMSKVIPQFDGPLLLLRLSIQMTGIWLIKPSPYPALEQSLIDTEKTPQ